MFGMGTKIAQVTSADVAVLVARGGVRVATTAALAANTYANGALGVGSTMTADANGVMAAIDGVTPVAGMRVLVKDETSGLKNGVYTVTSVGSAGAPWVLTRATDHDVASEFPGSLVFVAVGTANAGTAWGCTNASNMTVGTTAVTWSQAGESVTAVARGGTGATSAATALSNLGAAPLASPTFTGTVVLPSGTVTEAMQVLADNTTQNVTTSKHGYVPKAPNDTTKFLRGDATWDVPAGGDYPYSFEIPVMWAGMETAHTNWGNSAGVDTGQTRSFFLSTGRTSSGAQNDEITFDFFAAAGTYTIKLIHTQDSNRGIYGLFIDGVDTTKTIDGYAGSFTQAISEFTSVTVTGDGRHTVKLKMATKNGSSSNYYGSIQAITGRRTGA